VLVRVTCCTLCTSDVHTHAGRRPEPTPTVLGHEVVGRVAAVGPRVTEGPAVGDRVTWAVAVGCGGCFICAAGLPQKCERLIKYGHRRVTPDRPFGGGLADYVLLEPGTAIVGLPDGLPDVVAAMASCAGATASAVVRSAGSAVSGGTVAVMGAGPLGLSAIALARAAGAAAVVACDPDHARRRRATAFGATHACEPNDLPTAVVDLTAGRGADAALELAGTASAVRAALDCVRVGGTVVLAGTVLPTEPVSVDPEKVVRRMLTIRGVHNYVPADLGAVIAFLARPGKDLPWEELLGPTFSLADAEAAFAYAHDHARIRVAVVP
jgi:alcohol dehydrogenase